MSRLPWQRAASSSSSTLAPGEDLKISCPWSFGLLPISCGEVVSASRRLCGLGAETKGRPDSALQF